MYLTIFNAIKSTNKANKKPISQYDDESFIFYNVYCASLRQCFKVLSNEYILSQTINIDEPLKLTRSVKVLKEFKSDNLEILPLDLDYIYTQEMCLKVIQFFKDMNFKCILGKSRGFNNKDKFTLKGFIVLDIKNDRAVISGLLNYIQTLMNEYGLEGVELDCAIKTINSVQSPVLNNDVLYINESSKARVLNNTDFNIIEVQSYNDTVVDLSSLNTKESALDTCLEIFAQKGFTAVSQREDTSINFSHPSEKKSKGGFFFFKESPTIMHHPNSARTINIAQEFKRTAIGKAYFIERGKLIQKNMLEKPDYGIFVNERYLNVEPKIKEIQDFVHKDTEVLKIKSAMGTAKTNIISAVIKEAQIKKEKLRVILVSNRVSVARDFADKYEEYNMSYYKEVQNSKTEPFNLIVQFDSLYKFKVHEYDIVIFDEFISLLLHHQSPLGTNGNLNAAKFRVLLNKKILCCDAFLTGYEDVFFKDRKIVQFANKYRDDVKLIEYKDKGRFCKDIINNSLSLKEGEHISASFTSLNMLKVVQQELLSKDIRVISLTGETPDTTRELIYKRFKEDSHNAFQVILYTPTLTVGVSNVNNVLQHYHYDSSMSCDVISSLQMIKRSRTAKEIRFYLEDKKAINETSAAKLNEIAKNNIVEFYNNSDKTLLVKLNEDTGEVELTKLAYYLNNINAFSNLLSNDHANAFKVLLKYQFNGGYDSAEINEEIYEFDYKSKIKEIKTKEKENAANLLEEYSYFNYTEQDVNDAKFSTIELKDEEKVMLMKDNIQKLFKHQIPKHILNELVKIDQKDNIVRKIKNYHLFSGDKDYLMYKLSFTVSNNLHVSKRFVKNIKIACEVKELKDAYSNNDIKRIESNIQGFGEFIKEIGYVKQRNKYRLDKRILTYLKYL